MEKINLKIGTLSFSLTRVSDPEALPSLEIENDVSMVYEIVSIPDALALRDLLEEYLKEASDS